MSNYRRYYVPGGTFFITLVTHKRKPILTSDLARTCLRRAWRIEQSRRPFKIVAFCLLPDHLHVMMTLPAHDADFSTRVRNIKLRFTRSFLKNGGDESAVTASKIRHRERGVWQRRFWEHCIRDDRDFENHLHYIHYNPVKHSLVKSAVLWPYSTFHRYVKMGWYEKD
ncbi:MAG: transposase [candidate division KSB1 bacterium]|nr:transposase [candidate division KSB1 bacterium]